MEHKNVLISGDFVLDHHIYEGHRRHYGDDASVGVRVVMQTGGAALVHELLAALLAPEPPKEDGAPPPEPVWRSSLAVTDPVARDSVSGESTLVGDVRSAQRAYAFWRPRPGRGGKQLFWRVSEAMGFGDRAGRAACGAWPAAPGIDGLEPHVVVLSEGGMGFRDDPGCWRKLKLDDAWIVLKTAAPLFEGALWKTLVADHADRLVLVVSAEELRKSTARVPAGLSWEQTLGSLMLELRAGGALAPLARCRHLLVAFDSEGMLWLDVARREHDGSPAADCPVRFVYESGSIEGEHAHEVQGSAFGFLSCLAAGAAMALTRDEPQPSFERAMECSMAAMRDLRERGHGGLHDTLQGFPAARLAGVMKGASHSASRAAFTFGSVSAASAPAAACPAPAPGAWSLLRDALPAPAPAYDLAALVVRRGPIALHNLPHLRIGKLLSADPREIEALRSLTQVMRRYRDDAGAKRPLSIGVFGPPGAGKSFAVRELAQELVGKDSWLEFNLSQFGGPEDLVGAFHQIRDRVLQKQLPVAFFDEFDSHRYAWLQHLLAPMQDGKFQQGQLTHTIGKCIFVCAGGTSWSFESFGPPAAEGPDRAESEEAVEFRLLKGPDFKSRLDAYLDVVGPNRRQLPIAAGAPAPPGVRSVSGHRFAADPQDVVFPVRRALMIRAELKCDAEELLDVDEGLLHALLRVKELRHGSRSLSKLLEPFQGGGARAGSNGGRRPLRRSRLLPAAQLAMHVDADAFVELCAEHRPEEAAPSRYAPEDVEALAPFIHETWRRLGRAEGWLDPSRDLGFEELGPFEKESNREAACRMHEVLALVGLRVEPGEATPEEEAMTRCTLEWHLELLADAEHRGWMDWHLAQGWRYADVKRKDETRRLHPCLAAFSQLSEADKDKDRNAIRHYPDFARTAGRKIVRAGPHPGA